MGKQVGYGLINLGMAVFSFLAAALLAYNLYIWADKRQILLKGAASAEPMPLPEPGRRR